MSIGFTELIAVWGAVLSTFLAVREIWKTRLRIIANIGTTESGDKVEIVNLSSKPVVIKYYTLYWDNKQSNSVDLDNWDMNSFPLKPYTPIYIKLEEQYSISFKGHSQLHIRINIAGRWRARKIKLWPK